MTTWLKNPFGKTEHRISEAANAIGQVFEDVDDDPIFSDSVIGLFMSFSEAAHVDEYKTLSQDVDHIIQCTITSLSSPKKFESRIVAYIYIQRQIEECIIILKELRQTSFDFDKKVNELEKTILKIITYIFTKTKGNRPNLSIQSRDLLENINIPEYLKSIKKIEKSDILNTFFALCKLSFQSLMYTNNHGQITWKQILSNLETLTISSTDFINTYLDYIEGFKQFPFDMSAFIYLLSRQPLTTSRHQQSSIGTIIQLADKLKFDITEFLKQFYLIFEHGIKNKNYNLIQCAQFLCCISINDQLFEIYS
ncbi:unnamed protein product, partial [Didymodactylos carnosus]